MVRGNVRRRLPAGAGMGFFVRADVATVPARGAPELRADLVMFPELTLSGYPPEDLLFHRGLRLQMQYPPMSAALVAQWPIPEDPAKYDSTSGAKSRRAACSRRW